jgi:hypothetical protein
MMTVAFFKSVAASGLRCLKETRPRLQEGSRMQFDENESENSGLWKENYKNRFRKTDNNFGKSIE